MKNTTQDKILAVLKKIEKNTDEIKSALSLLVASDTSVKSIKEVPQSTSWATITDTPDRKTSEILAECKSLFSVWSYYSNEDLDKLCPAPAKTITKVFKESIEPDRLNLSYNDAIAEGIEFMSARERIILELQYFKATGLGLDIKGWTVTSTLGSGSHVLSMYRYDGGQFSVSNDYRYYRYSARGPRQLVSKSS